jgi:hypothetical protein
MSSYDSAEWFPDSRRLLVCGSAQSGAPRCYEQDFAGSPPKPVTPEGVLASIAPDGRTLLLTRRDGSFSLSSVDGAGRSQPVGWFQPIDRRIAWSRDSRSVYVQRGLEVPAIVERVDLASGARTVVGRLSPEGMSGLAMIYVMAWADDGRWYAYNYTSIPSTLFVVSGAVP